MVSLREWFGSETEVVTDTARPTTRLSCEELGERINPMSWQIFSFALSNGMSGVGVIEYSTTDIVPNQTYQEIPLYDILVLIDNGQGMYKETGVGVVGVDSGNVLGPQYAGYTDAWRSATDYLFVAGVIDWTTITMYDSSGNDYSGEIHLEESTTVAPEWLDNPALWQY